MIKRIAIHSVPRSGSSWVGQIFNSSPIVNYKLQPLFSYAFKDALDLTSSKSEIIWFFNKIAESHDDFLNSKEYINSGRYPIFKKSLEYKFIVYKEVRYHHLLKHLMETDNDLKVIGLVRNPKAVINSWFKAPKEFKEHLDWKRDEEWFDAPKKNCGKIEEFNGFAKWLECFYIFSDLKKSFPDRFIEVKYGDLISNTKTTVKKMFDFCEIPWDNQTSLFLKNSRSRKDNDAYSVYKTCKVDNSWEKELEPAIILCIDQYLRDHDLEKYFE